MRTPTRRPFPSLSAPLSLCRWWGALTALTVRLAVARGPEIALVPTWLVSVNVLMGVPVGSLLGGVDVASWAFLAVYAVGAARLGLAVWGTSLLHGDLAGRVPRSGESAASSRSHPGSIASMRARRISVRRGGSQQ